MLKGIPNILPPKLLKILMEMGHNDELVLCDANYPKFGQPARTVHCPGVGMEQMLGAVLSLFPLEKGDGEAVTHMQVTLGDDYKPEIWPKYDAILASHEGGPVEKKYLYKPEFYPRAAKAYAAVMTGETAFYATIILKKGTL